MAVSKGPFVFSRRRFYTILSSLLILIIVVPVVVYWSDQRIAEHARWDGEINLAQLFRMHMYNAADFINGTRFPWNSNESQYAASSELNQGETTLFYLADLDMAHVNQLLLMANNVGGTTFYQLTQSQRISFANNLHLLGDKIVYAYFLNNTSSINGVGPPFWYSGPSPPNEQDLQDASRIAANLTG